MQDAYSDRVNKLFQRLNNIHSEVEDERANKYKALETVLLNLEAKIDEVHSSRLDRFEQHMEKLKNLQKSLEDNVSSRQRIENDFSLELKTLQHKSRELIDKSRIDNEEQLKKFFGKVNNQIEVLATDLSDDLNSKNSLANLEGYLFEDIPRLKTEVKNEIEIRREIDSRIYEQFMGQVEELHQIYEQEKKEREQRSDDFLVLMKKVSNSISNEIVQSAEDRERNNDSLLNLIEQVVQRIKKEAQDASS